MVNAVFGQGPRFHSWKVDPPEHHHVSEEITEDELFDARLQEDEDRRDTVNRIWDERAGEVRIHHEKVKTAVYMTGARALAVDLLTN